MGCLKADPSFVCLCLVSHIDGRPVTQAEVDGTMLDVKATFYYLGDMLDAGGGCTTAITTRICMTWGKFRKLLTVLVLAPPLTQGAWKGLSGLRPPCHTSQQ